MDGSRCHRSASASVSADTEWPAAVKAIWSPNVTRSDKSAGKSGNKGDGLR